MGGYSEKCPGGCGKWFINWQALKDHIKAKHPEIYKLWLSTRKNA